MVKYSGEKVLAKPTTLRAPPCPAHSAAYACIPAARHLVTGYIQPLTSLHPLTPGPPGG